MTDVQFLLGLLLFFNYYFKPVEATTIPWYHQPQPNIEHRQVDSGSNSTSNSTKAGLAWPNGNTVDINQFLTTGEVSWYYTWSTWPVPDTDLEFVPMFWGPKSIDEFTRNIDNTIQNNNVRAVLGMNEPEQAGQSNITPSEGVSLWTTHLEPLKSKYSNLNIRFGSPAPSSAPSGKTWLEEFFTACNGSCSIDFVALHWYGTNASHFQTYIEDYHTTFPDHPLWITEWACQNFVDVSSQCSEEEVREFMNTTQQFLDEQTYVERYSWFGAMKDMQGVNTANALLDSEGEITALGEQYTSNNNGSNLRPRPRNAYKKMRPSLSWIYGAVVILFLSIM